MTTIRNKAAFEAGFTHGNSPAGTNGYRPGNRTAAGTLDAYNAGFQSGMAAHHEATRSQRSELAALNAPRVERVR